MLGFLKSLIGAAPPAAAKRERAPDWALLERETPKSWSPDPSKWENQ